MSDRTRIQHALERGDVRAHEWTHDAPDGGKPILRVGARIEELRKQGLEIVTVEKRPSALYHLESSPAQHECVATADAGRQSVDIFDADPRALERGGQEWDSLSASESSAGDSGRPNSEAASSSVASDGERAGVDRRPHGQRDTTRTGSLVCPGGPPALLIPNVAQAGIAASLHAQFDDDGLGWIADRYDTGKDAA